MASTGKQSRGERSRRGDRQPAAGSGQDSGQGRSTQQRHNRDGRTGAGAKGGSGRQADRRIVGKPLPSDDRVKELSGPLTQVLARLPATQRRVLEYRMGLVDGHPHSLADTARALGLGMSEAGEIESRAFEHIREVIPLDRLSKLLGNQP